jgi:WS/DGAT/MGAT family acyltransferase
MSALRAALQVGRAFTTLAGTGLIRPATSLNRSIGRARNVQVAHRPLGEMRAAAHCLGVTVNDIVLAAVGGGVAVLLEERGEELPVDIQVLVPVGHELGSRNELGNDFSAWLVRVPVGTAEPLARLRTVSESTRRARAQHEELAAESLLNFLAPVPQPIVARLGKLANHQLLCNLIVTNVPGPPVSLYMLNARLLEIYPFVPLAGNLTIGLAAMSYDGEFSMGFLADPETCPDAAVFVRGVQKDLAVLAAMAPN